MVGPDNCLFPALFPHSSNLNTRDWDVSYTSIWQATTFDINKRNKAAIPVSCPWVQTWWTGKKKQICPSISSWRLSKKSPLNAVGTGSGDGDLSGRKQRQY